MKILVTGGSGFIGSNLVRHLLHRTQHCVVNLDALTYAANATSLADVQNDDHYQFVHGDIGDANVVNETIATTSPDAIIHLAAESHVDRSIEGPAQFVQTNVVGTFHLLDAARSHFDALTGSRKSHFRFVHVSTDEVFGSLDTKGRFDESSRYDPHSPYSATKAASDHLARSWHTTYGLPVIVTNCSNNYGPYQFPEKLLPLMIIKCLNGDALPVYGRGENVRDWLHVEDHAAALTCVLNDGVPGETYTIGGDCELQNIQLVRRVCNILDRIRPSQDLQTHADRIEFVKDRPGHDFRYAIDSSKLQRELNWRPRKTIDEGLEQTIRWYLDHEPWWRSILDKTYQLQRLGSQTQETPSPENSSANRDT